MKPKLKRIFSVPVVLLVLGIVGCASTPQPFEYHDDRDEKPGPGLFSGEDGGYIIFTEPSEKNKDVEGKQADSK